jgi:hypothetical protein
MEFENTGLFIPKGIDPENVQDSRKYSFRTRDYIQPSERGGKMRERVTSNGFIDGYAMRSHWDLVLGQTRIVDRPWEELEDVKDYLNLISGVDCIKNIDGKTKKSIIIRTNPDRKRSEIKKDIKKEYGGHTPVLTRYSNLELVLEFKWLGLSEKYFFDDLIPIW